MEKKRSFNAPKAEKNKKTKEIKFKKPAVDNRRIEGDSKTNKKKMDRDKKTDEMKQTDGIKKTGRIEKGNQTEKSKGTKKKRLCPVEKKCGGCQYLETAYEEQLKIKESRVRKLLKPYCRTFPMQGMEEPFHYRNKVHAVFDRKRDGSIISGTYEAGTHRVVPVETCMIENEKADAIIRDIRGLLRSFKITVYNEDSQYGLLRHVLIRTAHKTGQIMVVLVLADPMLPSKNNFVKALRKLHPEITTILLNVNNKKTSMILGEKETVLYGKGYIEDELCGKRFRISSKSFYQVNSVQTEALYAKAVKLADLTGKERVLDAYCGIGTIGIIAAQQAGEVIGVELNPDAVRDAVKNAALNDEKKISFYQNDAGIFMTELAQAGEKADVVFMDPPRAGSDEAFLSSVVTLGPKRVVYISCNPETLERDLKYLTCHGYVAEGAWPFDMFPFTEGIETVVLLRRVTSKNA